MQSTERRKLINRSARWALSLSTMFGILLPVAFLQLVDSPPPYRFIDELHGEPRAIVVGFREASGSIGRKASVSYHFPQSKESLLNLLGQRFKKPEWTQWTDPDLGSFFFNRNGDQFVVHSRGESSCEAYFTIKDRGLWQRFKSAMGF